MKWHLTRTQTLTRQNYHSSHTAARYTRTERIAEKWKKGLTLTIEFMQHPNWPSLERDKQELT